jgi:dTMP kinase
MSKKGVFISLEGIEGCGKSTQARMLYEYISSLGYCVILTREPGGTPIAEKIRGILLDTKNESMTDTTELLLYLASRSQHVEQIIKPALCDEKIVICERFSDATCAYQGYARGFDLQVIETLTKIATYGLEPNLTIILDLEVEEGLLRAERFKNHLDRIESQSIDFHNKVRNGYLDIAHKNPERVKVIDANGSIEDVHFRIKQCVNHSLLAKNDGKSNVL